MSRKLQFTGIPVIIGDRRLSAPEFPRNPQGFPNLEQISFKAKRVRDAIEYVVYVKDKRITFDEAMNQLQHSEVFRNKFIDVLRNAKFDGYFLEFAPNNRPFEFTLVNAPMFKNIKADPAPFRNKLKDCIRGEDIISFMNLSRTSKLIVPCPISKNKEVYAHIANFVRYAPIDQIHSLLKQIPIQVKEFQQRYDPVWVNTHGLGVYWLHLRLDSVPKYYQTKKYKNKRL